MRISDWSSDVCSSDLCSQQDAPHRGTMGRKRTTDHQRCGNDLVLFGARNVNDALAITIIERCDGNRFLQSIAERVHQGLARAGKRRRHEEACGKRQKSCCEREAPALLSHIAQLFERMKAADRKSTRLNSSP